MAQSKSFFGNRRGSTKSHTYQVNGGQQITKDRVDEVKNPRTNAQMVHRCCIHTLSDAHAYLRPFVAPMWPSFPSPAKQLAEFRKANYPLVRAAAENGDSNFSFSPYKESIFPIGLYQFTEPLSGSIDFRYNWGATQSGKIFIAVMLWSPAYPNVKQFCEANDLKVGDVIICNQVYPFSDNKDLFIAQAIFKIKNIPDAHWQSVNWADVFDIKEQHVGSYSKIHLVQSDALYLQWEFAPRQSPAIFWFGGLYAIKYRQNKKLVFSRAEVLQFSRLYEHSFSEAIATYPQGGSNPLNGDPL